MLAASCLCAAAEDQYWEHASSNDLFATIMRISISCLIAPEHEARVASFVWDLQQVGTCSLAVCVLLLLVDWPATQCLWGVCEYLAGGLAFSLPGE